MWHTIALIQTSIPIAICFIVLLNKVLDNQARQSNVICLFLIVIDIFAACLIAVFTSLSFEVFGRQF